MRAPRIRPVFGSVTAVLAGGGPRIDVLALPLVAGDDGPVPGNGTAAALDALGVDLDEVMRLEKPSASAGSLTRVPCPAQGLVDRVVLVGTGDGLAPAVRTAGAALARTARGRDRVVTTVGAPSAGTRGGEAARALAEGLVLGSYSPPRSGVGSPPPAPVRRVDVVGRVLDGDLAAGSALAEATVLARDLANTPSSTKSPAWLATRARRAAAEAGLGCRVRDHRELAAEGFGGILAVGAAASRPPRLVELAYVPSSELASRRARPPHVVLVGKGITFDTGGISLKPREAMVPMKTDMSGAAAVLATLRGCRDLGVKVRVTGLLPLAENTIGASAYRPGDVVTQYGGRTVEVRNTDAEGRLVLADALAYADAQLDPDLLVDVATLTGAATQSLGRGMGALFTGDERLATALLDAGERSGERLWRMPLVDDYRPSLDSDHADLCHIATVPGVGAGAVVAALFLREFVGARRWAHLDIAGPARSERDAGLLNKGGTGFGARLLLRWLQTLN